MAHKYDCANGKRDIQRDMMIHHITQKDQEILLLILEIKDLKTKLKNAEAREAELNNRLSQSKTNQNQSSTLDVKDIEQICKSVVSPFTDMASIYMDRNIQLLKDQVNIF